MELVKRTVRWMVVAGVAAVAGAQSPQQPARQGGCYLPDASGKQVFVPNCGQDQAPQQKAPAADNSDAAKQFPFPGETPAQPANAPANPSGQQSVAPQSGAGSTSPAQQFPFPGEDKTPLVKPDGSVAPADAPSAPGDSAGPLKDAGSSGQSTSGSSSSSSSSSDSSGAFGGLPPVGDDDKGPLADDDTVIKKPHKVAPKAAPPTADEREAEDLSVAGFYMNDENYRGAYLRAADAVATVKNDPDAHLALADAARKLGKLDEALAEYKKTLTLDPVPKTKKAAEKAINEMK